MTNTRQLRRAAGATAALVAAGALGLTTGGTSALAAGAHVGSSHVTQAASKKFTFVTAGTTLNGKQSTQVGLFHGAISAGGKDVPFDEYDVAHLAGGTITVEHPEKGTTFTPTVDKKTCYVTFTTTGKFSLDKGTGAYKGIKGSGTYKGHGYGYTPRKKDGSCNLNAEPTSEVFEISGTGALS